MAQVHAQTETAVACEALSHLLLPAITDLDADTSQSGKVLRKHFAAVRDAMIRQYPWNFAEREAVLTVDPDAPASFRFKYAFALPNNPYCEAARSIQGVHKRDWKVVGRRIYTSAASTINLVYTARITDVSQWDAMFRAAFSLALAVACKELCRDEETVAGVQRAAADALANAWPVDAAEGVPDEMPELDIISVRGTGCPRNRWDC